MEISVEESFDYFITTLHRLDESNLELEDDDMLSIILEELDIEAHSFLHNWTVQRLIDNKYIPEAALGLTEVLRNDLIKLVEHKRDINQIRFDVEWMNVRINARTIIKMVEEYNGIN